MQAAQPPGGQGSAGGSGVGPAASVAECAPGENNAGSCSSCAATATAIANMQAIVGRYGPAPKSFVVVPIVGAFFVDLMNLAVLTVFLLPGFIIRP